MPKTGTEWKVINAINTRRNSTHVNRYALLQLTTILMIATLLYTVLKQVHLMTREKAVSVSCKHLHKLFCFVFLPFYYRLRFEMVIHTWRWILCHLSWLVFRGNLPNGQQPQLVSVSVSILCHKHKFSLHKNCSTHRHQHARVYWLYILYIQRNSEPAETDNRDLRWGSFYSPVPTSAPFEQMRHNILRSKHIKDSKKKAYLLWHRHNLHIFGVIPFVRWQKDNS